MGASSTQLDFPTVRDVPAVTTEQMRVVDRAMMEDYGISLERMMENAGRNLAELVRHKLGGRVQAQRIVVLTAGLCLAALGAACTPQPTLEPTRTPRPSRTLIPSRTPTRLPPSPTRVALQPTAAPSTTPTFTATTVPPSVTRTRVPATSVPTATFTPAPPPRPLVWDPRLDELKIQYIPAEVAPGQPYWRLTHAEFWGEEENQGKNHIFVNVLDENGVRLIGETITIEWLDGQEIITTQEKPAPEYSANYPMDINHYPSWHTLGAFSARVNGLPSDIVKGMGRPPPKSRPVVYLLTFQRSVR